MGIESTGGTVEIAEVSSNNSAVLRHRVATVHPILSIAGDQQEQEGPSGHGGAASQGQGSRMVLPRYLRHAAKRHLLHEHPERATSRPMPEVLQFLCRPEVGAVTCHMCAFGMTSTDRYGEDLVHKATRLMSSLEELLKRMNTRCSDEEGGERHRHVHLVQGRARLARVYPMQFCIRVCEGIAAQKRREILGVQVRPITSVEEMRSAESLAPSGGFPSAAVHGDDGEK